MQSADTNELKEAILINTAHATAAMLGFFGLAYELKSKGMLDADAVDRLEAFIGRGLHQTGAETDALEALRASYHQHFDQLRGNAG